MQNTATDYIDLIPIAPDTVPVTDAGGYGTSTIAPLIRLYYADDTNGLQSGVHISCNCKGYCVVSTYTAPDLPEQNWLDRTIVLASLNRIKPALWYLAKVHNTTGAYSRRPQAAISNDGKKVVWASNWRANVGMEQVFVMQLDMPSLAAEPPKSKGLPWSMLLLGDEELIHKCIFCGQALRKYSRKADRRAEVPEVPGSLPGGQTPRATIPFLGLRLGFSGDGRQEHHPGEGGIDDRIRPGQLADQRYPQIRR